MGANPAVAVALQKHVMQHVQIDSMERAMEQAGVADPQNIPPEVQVQIDSLAATYMAEGMKAVQDMGRQLARRRSARPCSRPEATGIAA